MGKGIDYSSAGVNIEAGNKAVEKIKACAASTFSPHVLSGLGSFGSFFDLSDIIKNYTSPVMVQSIDGVGTKIIVAGMAGNYCTIGRDLLSACVNDIAVHGAKPLTFLDYIANDTLDPDTVAEIVAGMADGCCEEGISLVGGETAEMPGTYLPGEHDLVGIVTGVVEKDDIINGKFVEPGDIILGAASSGLHTNGYSLARKVFFDIAGLSVQDPMPLFDESGKQSGTSDKHIGEILLEPHVNYSSSIQAVLADGIDIKSMAHITGGGLVENVPRVIPGNCDAVFDIDSWPVLPVFSSIQHLADIDPTEMYRAFNMGIGLCAIVSPKEADSAVESMQKHFKTPVYTIGAIAPGNGKTVLKGMK